jgi:phosphatidylserine synthase
MTVENLILAIMLGLAFISMLVAANIEYNREQERSRGFAEGILITSVAVFFTAIAALVADYYHLWIGVVK